MIEIKPFESGLEEGIANLILPIQKDEFGIEITREQQPDLSQIETFYQVGNGNFWCAISKNEVIGTIALVDIGNRILALRKMFVRKDFRGNEIGVARDLLSTAFQWASDRDCIEIFLGTTDAFKAAHRFYEKNGFMEVSKEELPKEFPVMTVDSKFYVKQVK